MVFDDEMGTWREYFTGIIVKVAEKIGLRFSSSYLIDSDEVFYDELSIGELRECSATEFSEAIAKYSDMEIKEMVYQLHELEKYAAVWKRDMEAGIEAVRAERAAKEAGSSDTESKLAANFGKYGDGSMGTGHQTLEMHSLPESEKSSAFIKPLESVSIASMEQKETNSQMAKEVEQLQWKLHWIRQKRCSFCGGEFKGLFRKSCINCGKEKDY